MLAKFLRIRHYSADSGLRLQQWILDTCLRPYDKDWLNYQQEMALRHTSLKKNKTDNVESAPTIHLRDIVAFTAVMNDPNILKPFLSAKGDGATDVEKMHQAWCKSLLLQIALSTNGSVTRKNDNDHSLHSLYIGSLPASEFRGMQEIGRRSLSAVAACSSIFLPKARTTSRLP